MHLLFSSCSDCNARFTINLHMRINEASLLSENKSCYSGQALCGTCRDETHRAKMFSQHDVIHMSKKTKELHRRVSVKDHVYKMVIVEGRCTMARLSPLGANCSLVDTKV